MNLLRACLPVGQETLAWKTREEKEIERGFIWRRLGSLQSPGSQSSPGSPCESLSPPFHWTLETELRFCSRLCYFQSISRFLRLCNPRVEWKEVRNLNNALRILYRVPGTLCTQGSTSRCPVSCQTQAVSESNADWSLLSVQTQRTEWPIPGALMRRGLQ